MTFLLLWLRAIGRANPIYNAGSHLSPGEFHAELKLVTNERGAKDSSQPIDKESSSVVLVDVRNRYESRIGKFNLVSFSCFLQVELETD